MSLFIGIDWSEHKHDIEFMNEAGAALAQLTIPHSPDGFLKLDAVRRQLNRAPQECLVALETAHNLVIDFLWSHDYTHVYVVPPNVVKSSRGRFGSSGARTDTSDAHLLADLLRTDRARLHPWHPDSLLTRQLRAKVSFVQHLTRQSVRLSNRLRAVLGRYYPAALHVFSELTSPIALDFIRTYPTSGRAEALTWAEFQEFAEQHRYPQPKKLKACFARLQQAQPTATPETIQVYQEEAVQLATLLLSVVQAKQATVRQAQHLFQQHPDREVFESLPGAGELLAPALLAKFGDDRQRFPSPASIQALAGTCPVTEQSGKRQVIKFRQACDREFRSIVQQWALMSLPNSTWAQAYYQQLRPRCHSDSHAVRCLANRWLAILWKLWQTHQAYDEAHHLKQRATHSKPRRHVRK